MPLIAVQQIMLGSVSGTEQKAASTLAAIKAAGYDGIELNGFQVTKTPLLVRALTRAARMPSGRGGSLPWERLVREAGLSVVALHTDLGSLKRDPESVIARAHALDTRFAVITGMYRFDYTDRAAVEGLARDLNECGRRLKEDGISLLYHNHNIELSRVAPGLRAFDVLLAGTDPELVNFEFDSYWPCEAGADPLALMRQLGNRMKLWHINDRGTRHAGASITPILKSDSMELGYGNMDLEALAACALETGVKGIILESHRNWVEKSPLKSLQLSAEFLHAHAK